MASTALSSPQRGNISLRKTNKPLMEKRRRARINDSLSQLKSLVIQSCKKDSSQFNKLEKADILELTVKHLRNLQEQQQQQQLAQASDSTLARKYQAGFLECANEVIRYIGQSQGFSDNVKARVIHHLASCIQLSSKVPFAKNTQPNNSAALANSSNGLQTMSAQLPNGQIIQIVNNQFQNIQPVTTQFTATQPIPIAPAPSSLPISTSSTSIPVTATSDPSNTPSGTKSSNVRYTQPLHIQIPQVLSPVIIQTKPVHQKPIQVIHKIQDTVPHILCNPQETLVSSTAPSPQPMDATESSPLRSSTQKSSTYYTNEDQYVDYIPRSRTYSLTSSASSESELTSPLNLSQSPQFHDHKDTSNYPSPVSSYYTHSSNSDKSSPPYHPAKSWIQSHYASSNFTSVIVDGRKTSDSQALKYMRIMDEERMCFRHDGTSSPASSVGEERLWRPW